MHVDETYAQVHKPSRSSMGQTHLEHILHPGICIGHTVGSFWWKNILKLTASYKQWNNCNIGKGNTILLWWDDCGHGLMKDVHPELFSYVIHHNQTLEKFSLHQDITEIFHIPLSVEAC